MNVMLDFYNFNRDSEGYFLMPDDSLSMVFH